MTFVKSLNLGNLHAINVRAFCNSKNANCGVDIQMK